MSEPAIEAFEQAYAERSGVTVEALHARGRFGAPCDCGEPGCEGFQMMRLRDKLLDAGWVEPVGHTSDIDWANERFCANCGHLERLHYHPASKEIPVPCLGVHVRGIANTPDAFDEACGCTEFVVLT